MKIQAVIDRFESGKAVLLLGNEEIQAVWPRNCLPEGVNEGDHLQIDIQVNREATIAARVEAENLLKQLVEKRES
jgi:hypothetical protein